MDRNRLVFSFIITLLFGYSLPAIAELPVSDGSDGTPTTNPPIVENCSDNTGTIGSGSASFSTGLTPSSVTIGSDPVEVISSPTCSLITDPVNVTSPALTTDTDPPVITITPHEPITAPPRITFSPIRIGVDGLSEQQQPPIDALPPDGLNAQPGLFAFSIEDLPADPGNPATVDVTFHFPAPLPAGTR